MASVRYVLRPKSLRATRPPAPDPDFRLLGFDMTAERKGTPLGGNNIQAVVGAPSEERYRFGAPSEERYRFEEDVALWLPSRWWVTLRNHFEAAPDVGFAILASVADELGEITSRLTDSSGAQAALTQELFETAFRATGPDYWR